DVAARQHRVVNPQVSTPMPSGAPPDEPIASSGALSPPEDGPLPSSSLSLVQVVKRLPPPRPFLLPGNRVLALVSGLVVLAMLGGVLFLAVIPGVTGTGLHPGTLCLASDFPTSGPQDRIGQPAENAVQLAVMQNHDLGNGYSLKLIPYNDAAASGNQADPQRGASNMTDMVQTPCIVGMVGPMNSADALTEMPIAANAGLVMISPTNTNSGLTLRLHAQLGGINFDRLHPAGKKTAYFRICPSNVIQGIVDANFTFDFLKARGVYVIEDHTSYGAEMAGGFSQGFLLRGGTIVGTESLPF